MAQAMGGEANLTAIKDMTQKAELSLDPSAGGLKVTQTELWASTGLYREEDVLPIGKMVSYSDGKSGWVASPQGVMAIPDPERKQIAFEIFRMWPALLTGSHEIKDEANGTIGISDKEGNSLLLSIDPATGLPASASYSEAGTHGQDVLETYADWQESNGVRLPRKITITQNGKHFADIKVTSVAINQGLTPEQLANKP
jgi:hypothetical protein